MTPHEIELATALDGCSLPPATLAKRFIRDQAFLARHSPEREITLRQRHYLELLAWRFRRQLPDDLVPEAKPLNLPKARKPPKRPRRTRGMVVMATPSDGQARLPGT
jgi:hypothetical protein